MKTAVPDQRLRPRRRLLCQADQVRFCRERRRPQPGLPGGAFAAKNCRFDVYACGFRANHAHTGSALYYGGIAATRIRPSRRRASWPTTQIRPFRPTLIDWICYPGQYMLVGPANGDIDGCYPCSRILGTDSNQTEPTCDDPYQRGYYCPAGSFEMQPCPPATFLPSKGAAMRAASTAHPDDLATRQPPKSARPVLQATLNCRGRRSAPSAPPEASARSRERTAAWSSKAAGPGRGATRWRQTAAAPAATAPPAPTRPPRARPARPSVGRAHPARMHLSQAWTCAHLAQLARISLISAETCKTCTLYSWCGEALGAHTVRRRHSRESRGSEQRRTV